MNHKEEAALDLLMEAERKAARFESERLSDPDDDIEASMDMYEFEKKQKEQRLVAPRSPDFRENSGSSEDDVEILRRSRPQTASSALRLSRVLDTKLLQEAKEEPKIRGKYNSKIQAVQIPKLPHQNFKEEEDFFNEMEEKSKMEKTKPVKKEKLLKLIDFVNMDEKSKEKKFKELLSANKETNLVFQREKTSIADLEKVLKRLENEEKLILSQKNTIPKTPGDVWAQKIANLESKYQEEETKMSNMKIGLNKMARILTSECGDFGTVDELLKDEKGGKDRAQRLELLKAKIRDLKEGQKRARTPSMGDTSGSIKNSGRTSKPTKSLVGGDKKKEIEEIRQENEGLAQKIKKMDDKSSKMEAKRKFLHDEMKDLKGEFELKKRERMDQSSENDNSIKKLKEEIAKMASEKEKLQKMEPQIITKFVFKHPDPNLGSSAPLDSLEIMQMKEKLDRLRSIARDKDAQINNLISTGHEGSYGGRNTPGSKNQFFMTNPSIGASHLVDTFKIK